MPCGPPWMTSIIGYSREGSNPGGLMTHPWIARPSCDDSAQICSTSPSVTPDNTSPLASVMACSPFRVVHGEGVDIARFVGVAPRPHRHATGAHVAEFEHLRALARGADLAVDRCVHDVRVAVGPDVEVDAAPVRGPLQAPWGAVEFGGERAGVRPVGVHHVESGLDVVEGGRVVADVRDHASVGRGGRCSVRPLPGWSPAADRPNRRRADRLRSPANDTARRLRSAAEEQVSPLGSQTGVP